MAKESSYKIKVVDKDSAREYLRRVLKEWREFNKSHTKIVKAILILLDD